MVTDSVQNKAARFIPKITKALNYLVLIKLNNILSTHLIRLFVKKTDSFQTILNLKSGCSAHKKTVASFTFNGL